MESLKNDSLILTAANLAARAHGQRRRKYHGQLFLMHPIRVAGKVATLPQATPTMVAAAFLHDVPEDENDEEKKLYWEPVIEKEVGADVLRMVLELTNPSKRYPNLKRPIRKQMDREHLKLVSLGAKLIKFVDRIDNINDMDGAADDFKLLYSDESRLLADALERETQPALYDELIEAIKRLVASVSAKLPA